MSHSLVSGRHVRLPKAFVFVVLVICLVTTAHALVDLRLFRAEFVPYATSNAIACVFAVLGAALSVAACLLLGRVARNPFWVITAMVVVYVIASFVIGVVGALYVGLRLVTGPQYLRILSVITAVVNRARLRPAKTWVLIAVGFCPLLLQPIALLLPSSHESRFRQHFLTHFALEIAGCACVAVFNLTASYRYKASSREARAVEDAILEKATRTQVLLETSMPPMIARSLLAGTPAFELTHTSHCASVAFIELVDCAMLDATMGDGTTHFMVWLNVVYASLDNLVRAYGELVNKVEIVAQTYIVTAGVPIPHPNHAVLLACFAADVRTLCYEGAGIPGVGRVRVRIGIHSGPVTGGLIGRTRRFYRIFGDTVNVASRMMSTGADGRIHCSDAAAMCMQHHATPVDRSSLSLLAEHDLALVYRGEIEVKGKGPMHTHWLVPLPSPTRSRDCEATDSLIVPVSCSAASALDVPAATTVIDVVPDTGTAPEVAVPKCPLHREIAEIAPSLQLEGANRALVALDEHIHAKHSEQSVVPPLPLFRIRIPLPAVARYLIEPEQQKSGARSAFPVSSASFHVPSTQAIATPVLVTHSRLKPSLRDPQSAAVAMFSPSAALALAAARTGGRDVVTKGILQRREGSDSADDSSCGSDEVRAIAQLYVARAIRDVDPAPPAPSSPARLLISGGRGNVRSIITARTSTQSGGPGGMTTLLQAGTLLHDDFQTSVMDDSRPVLPAVLRVRDASVASALMSDHGHAHHGLGHHHVLRHHGHGRTHLRQNEMGLTSQAATAGDIATVAGTGILAGTSTELHVDASSHVDAVESNLVLPTCDVSPTLEVAVLRPVIHIASGTNMRNVYGYDEPSGGIHPAAAAAAAAVVTATATVATADCIGIATLPSDPSTTGPEDLRAATTTTAAVVEVASVFVEPPLPQPWDRLTVLISPPVLYRPISPLNHVNPDALHNQSPVSYDAVSDHAIWSVGGVETMPAVASALAARKRAHMRAYQDPGEDDSNQFTRTDTSSQHGSAARRDSAVVMRWHGPSSRITPTFAPPQHIASHQLAVVPGHAIDITLDHTQLHAQTALVNTNHDEIPTPPSDPAGVTTSLTVTTAVSGGDVTPPILCAKSVSATSASKPPPPTAYSIAFLKYLGGKCYWPSLRFSSPALEAEASFVVTNIMLNHAPMWLVCSGIGLLIMGCVHYVALGGLEQSPPGWSLALTAAVAAFDLVVAIALKRVIITTRTTENRHVRVAGDNSSTKRAHTWNRHLAWLATAAFIVNYICIAAFFAVLKPGFLNNTVEADEDTSEQEILWRIVWLSLWATSLSSARIPYHPATAFCVTTSILDIAIVGGCSAALGGVSADISVIAYVSLLTFRMLVLAQAYIEESTVRADYAAKEDSIASSAPRIARAAIQGADTDATQLLNNLFPAAAVASLKAGVQVPPVVCHGVAVLYADMAGFTRMSASLPSDELMHILDAVYSRFDSIVEAAGMWKVETVGDAYIAVAGIMPATAHLSTSTNSGRAISHIDATHRSARESVTLSSRSHVRTNLETVFSVALQLQEELETIRTQTHLPLHLRLGVHCGSVVTGIVGVQRQRFCVLGSAIAEAEFAEEASVVDRVMCTEEAHRMYLASSFQFQGVDLPHHLPHQSAHSNDGSVPLPARPTKLFDVTALGAAYQRQPAGISNAPL